MQTSVLPRQRQSRKVHRNGKTIVEPSTEEKTQQLPTVGL